MSTFAGAMTFPPNPMEVLTLTHPHLVLHFLDPLRVLLLELHALRFEMLRLDVRGTADVKQEIFHLKAAEWYPVWFSFGMWLPIMIIPLICT